MGTIASVVSSKKEASSSVYAVGDEKEVTIDGTDYTVRIANNSNYDCSLDSKTACGFVVEFVDIVEQRAMYSSDTNVGGWPAKAMRTYLNGEFLAKLPSDLQGIITDITVVSGHGPSDSNSAREDGNWESTDKIYLLSTAEVWTNGVSRFDTATGSTRQLDYYANLGVTTSNYSGAIKQYSSSNAWWWLRAAHYADTGFFLSVRIDGTWASGYVTDTSGGVAPAFRIG